MRTLTLPRAIGLLLVTTSCAYHNPTQPTPPPVSDTAPAFVTLGLPSPGTVSAYVQNAHGAPLDGVTVQFSADSGTVSPVSAPTKSDGRAVSTLSASSDAHVTATVGTLSARATVLAPVIPPPTTPPTNPPGPTPTPPLPVPSIFLNVSSAATTGVSLAFGVSGPVTGAPWTWSFGDGGTAQTTGFSTSHTYASVGSYTATVTGVGTGSASATITVSNAPPMTTPPPAPAPTLVASMACTPGTHITTATTCNMSATYGGNPIPSGAITSIAWDWGDGQTSATKPTGSNIYLAASTYTVFATVNATTVDGAKTATTSKSVIIP